MSYSTITFTLSTATAKQSIAVELNMDSPLWPSDMTDSEKMEYWLGGANIEPIQAMICLGVQIDVTGKLK
jgi:hypothetical protein